MSGIYIHIPFCKQACHYCDFHFTVNLAGKASLTEAICREIGIRKSYLSTVNKIETIYFGGGTPSLLNTIELDSILDTLRENFTTDYDTEITLEANPDDLQENKLRELKTSGINRLSIGIQSFHEGSLRFINRVHTSEDGFDSVRRARNAGFKNISIDLIYGIPGRDLSVWKEDLEKAVRLQPEHISSYCLTIEEKTLFGNMHRKGKLPLANEEQTVKEFEMLHNILQQAGYDQYEISNFSKPGFISRHNSSYWLSRHYLGIGPSAHSFNGHSRQYNISSNSRYIDAVSKGAPEFILENLGRNDQINEYLLTRLRTKWGVDLRFLREKFDFPEQILFQKGEYYFREGLISCENDILKLTPKGKIFADKITEDLFME